MMKLVVTITLAFLAAVTRGSIIGFSGTPTDIKDGVTQTLALHCGLNDSAASSGIVGRRDVVGLRDVIIGRRDVTMTPDNLVDVTSVVVMKEGHVIASMDKRTATPTIDDPEHVEATGSLAGNPGERGFIDVKIKAPSTGESGDYTCKVNALDGMGLNVVFSRKLKISVHTPNQADLLGAGILSPADVVSSYNGVNPGQAKVFNAVLSNASDGDYDSKKGEFVAPRDGMYKFLLNALGGIRGNGTYWFSLRHNGKDVSLEASSAHVEIQGNSKVVTLRLSKGDVIKVVAWQRASDVLARHQHVYLSYNGMIQMPHKKRSGETE